MRIAMDTETGSFCANLPSRPISRSTYVARGGMSTLARVFLLAVCCLSVRVAQAYSPWEWLFNGRSYASQQQALDAMHALSSAYANYTKLVGISAGDANTVSYTYAAPDGTPVKTHPTTYELTVNGGLEAQGNGTLSDAITALQNDRTFISPVYANTCGGYIWDPQPVDSSYIEGVLDSETQIIYVWYNVDTVHCSPSDVSIFTAVVRDNFGLSCPAGYTGTRLSGSDNTTCTLPGNGTIQKRPVTDDDCQCTPHPISVATGDKYLKEVDYAGPNLHLMRSYHSLENGRVVGMGDGWMHSYNARIYLVSGAPVGVELEDGRIVRLQPAPTSGQYQGLSDTGYWLTQTGSSYLFESPDGTKQTFDSSGALTGVIAANGQVTAVAYSGGQLSTVTGPFGHRLTFHYDPTSGLLTSVTDPAGQLIQYQYQTVGSDSVLSQVTYQDGSTRQYLYEDQNFPTLITGIIDENGARYLTVTYDSLGRAQTSALASGADGVTVAYGTTTSTVTDALGGVTTYTFDDLGGDPAAPRKYSARAISGGGAVSLTLPSSLSADPQRRPTQVTDGNGNATLQTYAGPVVSSVTEASGSANLRSHSFSYGDPSHRYLPTLVTYPARTTAFTYDVSGNPLSKTITDTATGQSRTSSWTYDSSGRVLSYDGPRTDVADVTTYSYYTCTTGAECGQIHTITDAAGDTTTYNSYNAQGQPLAITDANGVLTTLTYDLRYRLVSSSTAGETATLSYWPTGLVKTVVQPDASYVLYTYDSAHRLTQVADGIGNKITYTLDAMGNRTAESSYDPANVLHRTHSRVINSLNQLFQDVNAAGTAAVTTTYAYDNNSNQTGVTGPLARNTGNEYDELNRLKQVTDPAGGVMHFAYDANDNLSSVIDPRGLITSYTYSGFGDLVSQGGPDSGSTTNTYDAAGNLHTSTDARGAVSTYSYDALNRPVSVSYSVGGVTDETLGFTYDAGTNGKGHLTGASDASHSMVWVYDPLGRVASKNQTVGTLSLTIGYSYTNGDLTTLTTPSGKAVSYTYNSNHQVTGISVNGIPVLDSATYEPFGAVSGWTWGNGTRTVRSYDADGNVSAIASAGSKSYSYDSASRIAAITDNGNSTLSWGYGYDVLDRLTGANASGQSQSFTYDSNGNRSTQGGSSTSTFTVDLASNRLNNVSGGLNRAYTYDSAGNTTSFGAVSFTYNAAGRMVSSVAPSATTAYLYNAVGQRIRKSSTSGATYFAYDEVGHLIGEYDPAGNMIQEIVWFGDTPVATVRLEICGLAIFYIHTDHLNAPRRISRRSTADLVWSWESDPFGTAAPNENPSGLGTFNFNLRFPGQYFDGETGITYNEHRYYDPSAGRYLESDPIGLAGGTSTYVYVSANPLDLVDPAGMLQWKNTTRYAFDLTPGSRWSAIPGAPPTSDGPNVGGNTIVDWSISSRCECAGSVYKFKEFTVNFRANVHIRPGLTDAQNAVVKSKEGDHVGDYFAWANGKGKAIAQERETRYQSAVFSTLEDCQDATSSSLDTALRNSVRDAWHDTVSKWDYPGGPHHVTF
jgi:RHS repeat-associated protein